ncbi:MAG: hypothetical protein WC623_22295 [Pedobacter sp.]|uniref:hypothetical protein n=1 Tax=Pedobacter sp. TaxID=1411316 RepID=UPI0035693A82
MKKQTQVKIPEKYETEIRKLFNEIESLRSEKVDRSKEIKAREVRLEEIRKEFLKECLQDK